MKNQAGSPGFGIQGKISVHMCKELGARGVTVNTVHPGPIDTDMNPADPEQNPMAALCESEGFQTLASVVAESRGLCRSEGGDGQPALVSSEVRPGRVLKSKRVKPSR